MEKKSSIPGFGLSAVAQSLKEERDRKNPTNAIPEQSDFITWEDLDRTLSAADKLCAAYRKTMKTEIDGIKKTIYVTGATLGVAFAAFQLILYFLG